MKRNVLITVELKTKNILMYDHSRRSLMGLGDLLNPENLSDDEAMVDEEESKVAN